ncbi:MAG TPA: VOC family protein [Chloroflexia bacterium]|nr:VOC family protein [Chloroflexia bacterium]
MAQLKGILHVNLTIAPGPEALAEARRFYVDVLGCKELYRPPETDNGRPGYWLDCGSGQQIHISAEQDASSYNGPSGRHAAFQVENLEELKAHLLRAGASVEDGMQFPNMRRCFARDPWGNRLELVQLG